MAHDPVTESGTRVPSFARLSRAGRDRRTRRQSARSAGDERSEGRGDGSTQESPTEAVFSPGASEDLATYNRVMNGISREQLSQIGQYRSAIQ